MKNKENCPIIELEEFLKYFEKLDPNNLPDTKGNLAKEARKMVVEMNNDRRLKNDAFSHEMFLRDQAAMISESVAKGKAEGLAEGEAKGKAEGKLEIVKNMLKLNISKEIISASTGFSVEEIEEIIKE